MYALGSLRVNQPVPAAREGRRENSLDTFTENSTICQNHPKQSAAVHHVVSPASSQNLKHSPVHRGSGPARPEQWNTLAGEIVYKFTVYRIMPNLTPEIKSTRLRNRLEPDSVVRAGVRSPGRRGHAVGRSSDSAFPRRPRSGGLLLFADWRCCGDGAWPRIVNARRIASQLESVATSSAQMSAGEFDKRIPPGERQQIEDLAASLDNTQSYLKSRVADLEVEPQSVADRARQHGRRSDRASTATSACCW